MDSINENLQLMNKNMDILTKNMEDILEILKIVHQKKIPSEKSGPKNKGKRWTIEQDNDLTDFFNQHNSLETRERDIKLAEIMARTHWSIHLRLIRLNLIDEDDPIKLRYPNYGKTWTIDEKKIVKEMFEKDTEINEIAIKMKRPETSVENLLEKMGLIEIVLEEQEET
jgi:hypothetical protein